MRVLSWFDAVTQRPSWQLFFVGSAFVVGVFVHSFIHEPLPIAPILVGGLGAVVAGLLLLPSRIALLLFVGAACLFGLGRYAGSFPELGSDSIAGFYERDVRIEGVIVNDPRPTKSSKEIVLDDLAVHGVSVHDKLIAWVPSYATISYGSRISFRCQIQQPESVDGFRYDRYLLRTGIVASCFSRDEPLLLQKNDGSIFLSGIYATRAELVSRLEQLFPAPSGSLSAGLLLGVKRLPDDVEEEFRKTGLSHIIAASGYNVTIVVVVLFGALAYFIPRQQAFWLMLFAIVVYVFLAGAEASVIRAGIMAATVLVARQIGKVTTARNVLLLAAVLMLLGNPRILIDDVGFQLSMLATIGLVVLAPSIGEHVTFLPESFGIREALSSTLAATIFTLPIMFFQFGAVSIISPIANLLVLPLVPYSMAFSAIAVAASYIHPSFGIAIGAVAWVLNELMLWISGALASLNVAQVEVQAVVPVSMVATVCSFVIAFALHRRSPLYEKTI